MRKWIVVAVMCLSLAGCVPTEQQIIDLSNDVALLNAQIDERQEVLVSGLDTVQERVRAVNEAVAAAKTLPAKVEAGIEASRPFNPYADEMAAGFGLITLIGGLFAKKKIETLSAKYKADKQGRESTLNKIAADNLTSAATIRAVLYDEIGKARARNGV